MSIPLTGEIIDPGQTAPADPTPRDVRKWLIVVACAIFAMVMVGGATRLTESGLSITQWKPLSGVIPPLNDAQWNEEFEGYKRIPQYAQLFPDMTMSGFKTIFFWEWGHRVLARVVGLLFVVPALVFLVRGKLRGALGREVLLAAALLALEPLVGWWMVASGLSERIEVSQYRLAAHLLIAAAVFATVVFAATGIRRRAVEATSRGFAKAANVLVALVFLQIGLGALVAGLRAGLVDNTWPLMDGSFVPEGLFGRPPNVLSVFEDVTTVQFDHRMVAYLVLVWAAVQTFIAWLRDPGAALTRRLFGVLSAALVQVALGITALVLVVPLWAGLAHQAFAFVLLAAAVAHARTTALGIE